MTGLVGGRLVEIRERLGKITPGPWSAKGEWVIRDDEDDPWTVAEVTEVDERGGLQHSWDDAAFIAAAPADLAATTDALLAVLALADEWARSARVDWCADEIRRAVASHLDPGATA